MADGLARARGLRFQASARLAAPDPPWVMRTYSGHSTARASNQLYRTNLAKGQTGLSVAFDLPTQTGYDPDAPEAKGEVGKVGVPVVHLGHMAELMDGIPLGPDEHLHDHQRHRRLAAGPVRGPTPTTTGVERRLLAGTTQNDIVKEYLSRGTYIFPPGPSRRLIVDTVAWTVRHAPRWNPINVCSYHLQEAGATPVQELAFALATAIGVVDAVRDSGQLTAEELPAVVGRISFFCNAGIRFVEETCKMRAFTAMWDRICAERWGVADPRLRRFRYGVQVNSLGLTEQQPENNVPRIVLEALGVTLSRRRPSPGPPAAGVERGPRPAPSVGSTVVAPHPADPRLRDRPAGVPRHPRRLPRGGGPHRRAGGRGPDRTRGDPRPRRGLRGHRGNEVPAGRQPVGANPAHRVRRAARGGRQPFHHQRAVAARPRRGRPSGGPRRGGRPDRRRVAVAGPSGRRRGGREPSTNSAGRRLVRRST